MIVRNGECPRRATWIVLLASGAMAFGFLSSCQDRLVEVTRFVDPCGTILANCNPGDFEVGRADVGDFCVDPACTVPGQCAGEPQPPLGTITDLCP